MENDFEVLREKGEELMSLDSGWKCVIAIPPEDLHIEGTVLGTVLNRSFEQYICLNFHDMEMYYGVRYKEDDYLIFSSEEGKDDEVLYKGPHMFDCLITMDEILVKLCRKARLK